MSDAQITHFAYNRGSSLGIATRLRAGLNPGSGKIFLCRSKVRDLLWAQPTMGDVGYSPGDKAAEASSSLHRQPVPKLRI